MKGKMWRVIKTVYNSSRSAVLLEGEKSPTFSAKQGVVQGCSLSPILFLVFISDLRRVRTSTSIRFEAASIPLHCTQIFPEVDQKWISSIHIL